MNLYKIVFKGKIAEGYSIEDVKNNLASLYKVDVGKIDRLFTGRSIEIKTDLDYQTAVKDREAFEKTGAVCSVISMEENADHSTTVDEEATPGTDSNKSGRPQSLLQPPPLRTNRRRYTIIHPLFMSFYSKDFYRDVAQNWKNYEKTFTGM
jgi:hypothetical protein